MIINRHNSHVIINNETLAAILNFRFHGILILSNILTQYEKNMFYYAMVIKRQMCHFSLINKPKTASWWPFWISNFSQISSILTNILTQCESKSNYVVLTILGISSCIMKPWLPSWISDFYQFPSQLTSHLCQLLYKYQQNLWIFVTCIANIQRSSGCNIQKYLNKTFCIFMKSFDYLS